MADQSAPEADCFPSFLEIRAGTDQRISVFPRISLVNDPKP